MLFQAMEKMLMLVTVLLLVSICKGIPLGFKLKVGDQPVDSINKNFAFGFRPSNVGMGFFNLAIWYQVTNETVVWTATLREQPVQVMQDAFLELENSGLSIKDGASVIVWKTELSCSDGCKVTDASMEDTGNFVLRSMNGTVWQSFDSPTNTLLVGQELVKNMSLVSGKYRLRMNKTSVGLYFEDYSATESYWNIINDKLDDQAASTSLQKFVLNQNGSVDFFDGSGKSFYKSKYNNGQRYPLDYMTRETVMRRITLESNGSLRSYSLDRASSVKSWSVVWQSQLLECEVYGTCGPFGICYYEPRKQCKCPAGFHRANLKNDSEGCIPNVNLTCASQSKFVEFPRTEYLGNDYKVAPNATSLEDCRKLCLDDCKCAAALYKLDGSGLCTLKTGGNKSKLFNGLQSPERASITLIKVSASDTSAKSSLADVFTTHMDATNVTATVKRGQSYLSSSRHVVLLAFVVAEFVIFCVVAFTVWFRWKKTTRKMWKKFAEETRGAVKYSYEHLQLATNNFSDKLGEGGFGSVYKGVFDKAVVAVKKLDVATRAENQFKAEVTTLGRIHHVNLVRLRGYCAEDQHRLLVYEYMSRGSLDQLLLSKAPDLGGSWKVRCSIALGVARGISYLHEECYECILHCDIKPQNILLDKDLTPKVSDFGLAKLMKKDIGLSVTTIRGTRGYLAPEWIGNQPITAKVDVYSYGMVLLQILSGSHDKVSDSDFQVSAFEKLMKANVRSISDPAIVGVNWEQFERMLKISFWCLQSDPSSRPTMSSVVKMLEDYDSEVHPPPSPLLPSDLESCTMSGLESQSILDPR